MAQNREFAEEIRSFDSRISDKVAKVKQNRNLNSLFPFVGEDQVLRAGGRLKNSSFQNSFTHLTPLVKNGTVSELLEMWCHEKTAYERRDITLNEIRSNRYWIICTNCKRCRNLRCILAEQKMANLPYDRITSASFLTVALKCLDCSISRRGDQNSRDFEERLYA